MAEDQVANGEKELLRTIFIQSMVPSALLGVGKGDDEPPLTTDHRSDVRSLTILLAAGFC